MNYLAHAFLAGTHEADWLGALLGDFVKGPLPGALPDAVARGVALHRHIDTFADSHPAFLQSRQRVSSERRRYSGIMVDMFYDHFLARHWSRFHPQPLPDFTRDTYALLARHPQLLPPRLASSLPYMQRDDWLAAYAEVDTISHALNRMGERMRQPNRLAGSGAELRANYDAFEADFLQFLPAAVAFVEPLRQT